MTSVALTPGTRVGVYEITAQIGVGSMGDLYRARDTKLDRDVALKMLPHAFATDPDRLARLRREAKTLASLNHPNIGGIYGVEEANGVPVRTLTASDESVLLPASTTRAERRAAAGTEHSSR